MRGFSLLVLAIGLFVPQLASAPAYAQATRTWIANIGNDADPCSNTAPCKTFAGAISKTAAGGEINCLDNGAYGAVTITKSITLSCPGVTAGVLASSTNGIIINAAATDFVYLRGLDIEGAPPASPGLNGIRVISAGMVHVEDCTIRGFNGAAPNGWGMRVDSTSSPTFVVSRTTFANNGNGAILVRPTVGSATGTIDRIIANRNTTGVTADTLGGATAINLTVKDSSFNGNSGTAITSAVSGGAAAIMVMRVSLVAGGTALTALGANSTIRVGESLITGNGVAASGNVLSYGTNQVAGNGNDGTLTLIPAPALK